MSSSKSQTVPRGLEPPMYLQRPSTGHSQDVRHILAKAFRDLYTRDPIEPETVKNLQVSKGSDDPYHEHYVESLQKAHTEWQQRMDEIAMLERHIMQMQARAMSAEERELNKASMTCENYRELGLPPVRSQYRLCIDNQLLHDHHLLTPADYLVPDPAPVPLPKGPKIPAYTRETLTSRQHNQGKVQTKISSVHVTGESLEYQTSLSDGEVQECTKSKKTQEEEKGGFLKKNGWKEFLSEEQRDADRKYLNRLQAKTNFLQNSRHISNKLPANERSELTVPNKQTKLKGTKQASTIAKSSPIVFMPYPTNVEFNNYKVGEVYEITLELKNVTMVMQQCRVFPPSSNMFSIGLGQFPGDSGLVAPGMSCTYGVRFTPSSLRDYDDFITVQVQTQYPVVVPLRARRPSPVLTIPNEVDLGSCLVDGIQTAQLLIKNEGGPGRFCLMPRNKWPTASIRSVLQNITKTTIKNPPFEIYPATFEMNTGQSSAIEVIFNPHVEKRFVQEMTIACDNCHISHFTLKGDGEVAKVNLLDIEQGLAEPLPGEFMDASNTNFVRFEDLNPFTYIERIARVSNCTKVHLKYQWMVYKPILASCFSDGQFRNISEEERVPDPQSAFSVSPVNGVLLPSQTVEFKLIFAPAAVGDFHSVFHMLLQNVPLTSRAMSNANRRMTSNEVDGQFKDDNTIIYDGVGSSSIKEVTVLGLQMKGKCIPLNVVLHPYALIIQAPVLRGSTFKKLFTMANHSYSSIIFKWESYTETYFIEIEPPFGDLDPGMAMDFEVSITGFQPGKINHTMLCHIVNNNEPLHLLVQAEIKSPELKIEQPSINFGLIRIGQCEIREMTIVNMSETVVKFTLTDSPVIEESNEQSDIPCELKISDTSGELRPFGRKTVTLTLIPTSVRSIRRICQVQYEGDKSCSVGIYAEAQNPVVCFLECEKFLPEVYLKVPAVFTVVLHNQTLLPTTFKWGKAEGSQCNDCVVEVLEQEGDILSWQQKTVSISFTPLKDVSFLDVTLPCHIAGQDNDIYVNISCNVQTLAVQFRVSKDGHQSIDSMELKFGEKVELYEKVKRYIHISNQTAIPAPYFVIVEYFTPAIPPQVVTNTETAASHQHHLLTKTPKNSAHGRKPSRKMKQAYNEMVLSKKKGAAFVVHPSRGQLQPFETQVIKITAHNNLWGDYKDNLIVKVGEFIDVKFPMEMNVIGCPLNFQLTGCIPGGRATVRFGGHVTGGDAVTRKIRINNPSPTDIRVDWQVFMRDDSSSKVVDLITFYGKPFPLCDTFGMEIDQIESKAFLNSIDKKISAFVNSTDERSSAQRLSTIEDGMDSHNSEILLRNIPRQSLSTTDTVSNSERLKVISCIFQTHNGVRSQSPFSVKPPQMVIPSRGHGFAELTFTPLSTTEDCEQIDFFGYAEGFLSLDNQDENLVRFFRPETYYTERLTIDFSANLKPALLTVEELEEDGMRFTAALSDIIKNNEIQSEALHTCSFKLTNNTQTPLIFKLKVKEPFLLVDLLPSSTQNVSEQAMQTLFCKLKPRHSRVNKVAFRVSMLLIPDTSLAAVKTGSDSDKKLIFDDFLTITFMNEAEQTVPLYATLTIPQMEVSNDYLDFGVCLVGQTRELLLDIFNTTSSHCYWKIFIENKSASCDDDNFRVVPDKGMLESYVTHVSNSKVTVKCYFTAKHSDAYDCSFVVRGMLGEFPRRIVVVGQGSYDGKDEAILDV